MKTPAPPFFASGCYSEARALGKKATKDFALEDPTPLVRERFLAELTSKLGTGNLRVVPKPVKREDPSTIGTSLGIDVRTFILHFGCLRYDCHPGRSEGCRLKSISDSRCQCIDSRIGLLVTQPVQSDLLAVRVVGILEGPIPPFLRRATEHSQAQSEIIGPLRLSGIHFSICTPECTDATSRVCEATVDKDLKA